VGLVSGYLGRGMKVTNADPPGAKAIRATRGMVSTNAAGAKGMVWRDASTETIGQIRDMTVVGATLTDNEDGTGVLTIGGTAGGSGLAPGSDWFNVEDYGAVHDGTTDDTAEIQAAIDAATAGGGGVIYFPPGVYIIGGALQDTGAFNGQLLLPDVPISGVDHIVITFKGALRPGFHPLYGDTVPLAAGLSVLRSTLTGASGTAACISGGNAIATAADGNNLEVNIENLVCLGPDNPTFTFWNLQACQGGSVDGLQISTPGAYVGTPTLPTNTNAYGIKFPQALFSNSTSIQGLAAGGFYTGVLWGELCESTGPLILGPTVYGIEIPLTYYPGIIFQLTATNVVRVLRYTGAPSGHKASHGLDILQYVRERPGSGSFETIYDIDDGSNYGSGYIRWYTITSAGGGAVDTFLRNGGTGIADQQIAGAWGGVTVKEEGVALATLATSIDFVGTGVTASGTGAAKTITIAAGGIGPLLITDTPAGSPLIFGDLLQDEDGTDLLYADAS
jgi:hypothetical protein